ncbi:unnamed protein product, partial [Mesorhabditis belari]|uniref:PHD-type domain-containing protein n=1 Tax=Mesorhabditis belari TaxID=2138241 RepID=A0AAF3EHJ2_9BILA
MASSSANLTEQFVHKQLTDSTAKILDDLGFTSTSSGSLDVLADVMRRYLENVCRQAKIFMEHGGRSNFDVEDVEHTFQRLEINGMELFDYMDQIGSTQKKLLVNGSATPVPSLKSTVLPQLSMLPSTSETISMANPTENEINERIREDGHILPFFPTLLQQTNTKETVIDDVETPSTSVPKMESEKRFVKQKDEFPAFEGDAISLGIVRKATMFVSRFDQPRPATPSTSATSILTKKIKKENIHQPKSARASPVPAHSPSPSTSSTNISRKVESSPNLKALENGPLKLTISPLNALRKEGKKRPISPLVTSEPRHVYDDIPHLEIVKKEIESLDFVNDFNAPTPEYRTNEGSNDDLSQPPILPIVSEKRKEKLKERKRKDKGANGKSLPTEPPLLEPILLPTIVRHHLTPSPPTGVSPICTQPIRIKIKDLNSSSPSASYSTEKVSSATPPRIADLPPRDSDSDETIPMVEQSPLIDEEVLQTTFPLNMSLTSNPDERSTKRIKDDNRNNTPIDREREHKKKKKKEKERRERERGKEREREKDKGKPLHKEKDGQKKEERNHKKDEKRKEGGDRKAKEEKLLAPLKIKLLSPTTSDPPATPSAEQPIAIERTEPLRIKIKPMQKETDEGLRVNSPIPPVTRMGVVTPVHVDQNSNRPRVKTKGELKALPEFPPLFSVDTKIIRPATPKNRSNTSTPVPPARNSPVPPLTLKLAKDKDKEKEREKEKHRKSDTLKIKDIEKSTKDDSSKSEKPANNIIKKINVDLKTPKEKKPEKETPKERPMTNGTSNDEQVWICPHCSVAWVEGADMVACDTCDGWYHWACVGIVVEPPKNQQWYCDKCTKKRTQLVEVAQRKGNERIRDDCCF